MSKLIVFDIYQGSFSEGFAVSVSIQNEQATQTVYSLRGRFPANADLQSNHQAWSRSYQQLPFMRRMVVADDDITEISVNDFRRITNEFTAQVEAWFRQAEFNELTQYVLAHTGREESLRVSIRPQMQRNNPPLAQSDIDLLLRLPWHLWNLFRIDRPESEILLETRGSGSGQTLLRHPKILAIIGHAPDLETSQDRKLISKLRWLGASVKWLEQPSVADLNDRLWEGNWDVIFFAGHSSSPEQARDGLIQLNANETVSLLTIREGFSRAARNNLKFAIINSCDSLNAAENLIEAGVPYTIVARNLLIDQMAVTFLKFFLEEFTSEKPLSVAIKEARARLTSYENRYPCASWLPILCQRPGAPDLIWKLPWWVVLWRKITAFIRNNQIIVGLALAALVAAVILFLGQLTPAAGICGFEVTENYMSCGERSLISDSSLDGKPVLVNSLDNVLKEMKKNAPDYNQVFTFFEDAWVEQKGQVLKYYPDAQTLIYRNNSLIREDPKKAKAASVIAAVVPLKNSPGAAQEMLQGIAQAQEKAIGDEIYLQVLIADEDGGSGIQEVAKEIASHQQVLAVVGTRKSESVKEVLPTYEENGLALISGTATDSTLRNRQGNSVFFRTVATTETEADVLREYLTKAVGNSLNVAVFRSGTYGEAMANDFERFGVTTTPYGFENVSSEELSRMARQGKQAIAIFPEAGENDSPAIQAMNVVIQNNGALPVVGGTSTYGGRLISHLNESNLENPNFVIALPWVSQNPDCKESLYPKYEFDGQACRYWGGSPSWRSAMSYDATQAVINALRELRDQKPSRQSILERLRGGNALGGVDQRRITFIQGERQDAPMILVKVVPRSTQGERKFEYVPYDNSSL